MLIEDLFLLRHNSNEGGLPTPAADRQPRSGVGGRRQPMTDGRVTRKVPRRAAVSIFCTTAGQYEAIIAKAKRKIKLPDLGIEKGLQASGVLTLEIPGSDSVKHADALAERLLVLFATREDIKISRPCKMAELRVKDLDDAVSRWDVSHFLAEVGGCRPSEVTTGTIRKGPNGLGTVWVRCPLAAANKIAEAGRIVVGWAMARVQILDARPLQCFRCLEGGHVRATCRGVDRSTRCYRCGDPGHRAQNCMAQLCCPICTDLGRPANHRASSRACAPAHRRNRGGRSNPTGSPTVTPTPSVVGVRVDPKKAAVQVVPVTEERPAPRIVEDLTILDPEPLPQRPKSRLSWASLSRSRPTSHRPSSSMSVEREGTEDP